MWSKELYLNKNKWKSKKSNSTKPRRRIRLPRTQKIQPNIYRTNWRSKRFESTFGDLGFDERKILLELQCGHSKTRSAFGGIQSSKFWRTKTTSMRIAW